MKKKENKKSQKAVKKLEARIDELIAENTQLKLDIELNDISAKKAQEMIKQLKAKEKLLDESLSNTKRVKSEYEELLAENKNINSEIKDIKAQIQQASDELNQVLQDSKNLFKT